MSELLNLPSPEPAPSDRFADDFDAIYKAYTQPEKFKLTETQQHQMQRWKFAREWYTNFEPVNDLEVVRALMRHYQVSQRQAYNDVRNCQRFFSTVDQVNEEFEKVLLIESVKRRRKKGMNSGTMKGLDIAAKSDASLVKIFGFDRDKAQMPEPKIVVVNITANPADIGALPIPNLEAKIKGFWKKKDEQEAADIQDTDYEDILENPRNEQQHQRE